MPTAQASEDGINAGHLLSVLTAFKNGDFSQRVPNDWPGMAGKIVDTLNEVLTCEERIANDFANIAITVGEDGKISQRVPRGAAVD